MLALYRAALRLLPASFRLEWMGEAEDDVRRAIRQARLRGGSIGGWIEELRACGNVLRVVPREWWRVAQAKRAGRRGTTRS